MTSEPITTARVSIAERLVPSLSLGLASIAGAVGAVMTWQFFESLRHAETAGYYTFFTGTAKINLVTGGILAAAALFGVVGIAVCAIRMFTTNKTASPPGVRLFACGILSLISPAMAHYALWLPTDSLHNQAGVSSVANAVNLLTYGAMIATGVSLLLLLIFSFVPLRSRLGRKYSPTVALVILEIAIVCLSAVFFWAARIAMHQTDTFSR